MLEKTKKCPFCAEDINYDATKCPKCQSDLRSWFAKHKIMTFFLIIILFVSVVTAMGEMFNTNSTQTKTEANSPVDINKKFNSKNWKP